MVKSGSSIDIYEEFLKLYQKLSEFEKNKIPLCAAETYISDFVKNAMKSKFEGKYAMSFNNTDNGDFIGSNYIKDLFSLLSAQCAKMFDAEYADARTLSGMNCFMLTILALKVNRSNLTALVTSSAQGGHASVPPILDSLGIAYQDIPYDYTNYQINYNSLNSMLTNQKYDFIIFCQSDLLQPPDLSLINTSRDTVIIYDATQTLGLIASKVLYNPLAKMNNIVMIGGTHKTLPGPTCGLILTNNQSYIRLIENTIAPTFLRNVQPNNVASLLLALIEQEKIGALYQKNIVRVANILATLLNERGFVVAQLPDGVYTRTHQIFLLLSSTATEQMYLNAQKYNITLNKKNKPLFSGCGIRLGTQEIARYCWDIEELTILADLLLKISIAQPDTESILSLRSTLIKKKIPTFTPYNISIV